MQSPHTRPSDCAVPTGRVQIDIHNNGQLSFKWSVRMTLSGQAGPGTNTRLDEFSKTEVAALRSLRETAECEEIRRAAAALHRYARGLTMSSAVEPTPYGVGWLRGLREAFEDGGIEALREREYRPPR